MSQHVTTRPGVRPRPLLKALTLAAVPVLLTVASALLLNRLAPGLEPLQQRLAAVLFLALLAVAVTVARHRDLLSTGAVRPGLLAIPALAVMAPFAAGLKNPGLEAAPALVIGYLATGIYEELCFAG